MSKLKIRNIRSRKAEKWALLYLGYDTDDAVIWPVRFQDFVSN